jgi:hypothetical protein
VLIARIVRIVDDVGITNLDQLDAEIVLLHDSVATANQPAVLIHHRLDMELIGVAGFDPVRRELTRRSLERLLKEKKSDHS